MGGLCANSKAQDSLASQKMQKQPKKGDRNTPVLIMGETNENEPQIIPAEEKETKVEAVEEATPS
jgi:hypothetical protein